MRGRFAYLVLVPPSSPKSALRNARLTKCFPAFIAYFTGFLVKRIFTLSGHDPARRL
jgi:hypothetical protein